MSWNFSDYYYERGNNNVAGAFENDPKTIKECAYHL